MLNRAFLNLQISKFSWGGGGGGHAPRPPLAARAFRARNLPRLVLKSGYGPDLPPFSPPSKLLAFFSLYQDYIAFNFTTALRLTVFH